jgi:acetoin utilization deacetylase AcuC-like enzyme
LSTEGYELVNDTLFELISSTTGGKVVSVLEGGYDLQILPVLVANHIRKMMAL